MMFYPIAFPDQLPVTLIHHSDRKYSVQTLLRHLLCVIERIHTVSRAFPIKIHAIWILTPANSKYVQGT